ncbi:MAG: OsmC family peroxiredoxin [Gemmatimonadales bacterium]|jgi:osmotically inducible protein OsmC
MPTSKASARWEGVLKSGRGEFKAGSGAFSGEYSFPTRFEGKPGTNPEELIAAAHAACFSMALSANLEKAGTPAQLISTTAHCTLDVGADGARITKMRLVVQGRVPEADRGAFADAANKAKEGCPVSKALKGNVEFELEATLE